MNPLQALVTGYLLGSILKSDLMVELEAKMDHEGNYLPAFEMTGESGTRLRVIVEVVHE